MEKIDYKDKDEILRILKQHKEELYKKYGVKEIGLFGSFARGEETDKSDIDILVEFEKPVGLLTVSSLENYLSDLLGIKADVVRKRNIRKELKENILNEVVNL
ncbi:MAG: nucleotidyltransferase family protein [Deltaproteobacteria bacterium]|jgi:predicted nucleotidyltransferase|nr:nucleotidyltransferase family protein [Deltaproteobacteria bacterium]